VGAFTTRARASEIETTGRVYGFGAMRISGDFLIAATATGTDGRKQRLLVEGGTVTVRGSDIGLLARVLTISPVPIEAVAGTIPPTSAHARADRATVQPRLTLPLEVEFEGNKVTLDGKAVRGRRSFRVPARRATLYGRVRLAALPATVRVGEDDTGRAARAGFATPTFFSWRGSGGVELGGKRFAAPLTLLVKTMTGTLTRRAGGFDIDLSGEATQVAVGGKPQLRTTLEVKIALPERALYPGISEQLTWVMETAGPWEAIVTGVRGVNVTARWARLHVDDPPPLDGPGGDSPATAPLRCVSKASAFAEFYLCSQIAPEKGAEAPVIFHVPFFQPVGTFDAVYEITGNFPTVRVTVEMDVKPR
jgi:hypothetical protein